MLRDEKILITGPAGQIAFPIAEFLSKENEVWGIARFGDQQSRDRVEAVGVTTRQCDIGTGDFSGLPTDFTYLLHLAAYQGPETDYDYAITVNAEGAGFLMHHCRKAKAALVMSTSSVYRPDDDPMHAFLETDPIGGGTSPWAPTYAVSKVAQEAVVRQNARSLGLPTVIARMNASYGPNGGLPALNLDALLAGNPIVARADPCPYSPIYQDDINEQVEPLLRGRQHPRHHRELGRRRSRHHSGVVGLLRHTDRPPGRGHGHRVPGVASGHDLRPRQARGADRSLPGRLAPGNAGNGRRPHGALGRRRMARHGG